MTPTVLSCYRSSMSAERKEVKKMKSTVFRLDPETHKALRIAAIEEGISMNEALKQAVQTWLNDYRKRRGAKK